MLTLKYPLGGRRLVCAAMFFAGVVFSTGAFGQARKPEVPQVGRPWAVGLTTMKEGWVKAPSDPEANSQGYVHRKSEVVVGQLKMVPIPAGTFMMGSLESEAERRKGEELHEVTLTKPFWLGVTEVTQSQWEALMGNNPSDFKGAELPVDKVSWDDALSFCRKLTEQERAAGRLPEGYAYTLPSEAQWEYACRAGAKRMTVFSFGDALNGRQANCNGAKPYGTKSKGPNLMKTRKVGSYAPNAWGLYDMHGNLYEWCLDGVEEEYSKGTATDPVGKNTTDRRIRRGGCWAQDAVMCRSACRSADPRGWRGNHNGFRVALSFSSEAVP